ncbi:hypothetical protein GCM10027346_22120 [Hymenobacter seoulensis]
MKIFVLLRAVAVAAVLVGSLTACDTGEKAGATNVERGDYKSKDPAANMPNNTTGGDSATSGLNRSTDNSPTGREVYEDAANRKDKNNDGIAD